MPIGYWIARVDIEDHERYQRYVSGNGASIAKYGGKFVVCGGRYEAVEGPSRTRNVVIEFPSYDNALRCWHSQEYQEIRKIRTEASTGELIVIEGYDP